MNDFFRKKQVQLVCLILVTVGVLATLWSFVILSQRESLNSALQEISLKKDEVKGTSTNAALALKIKADLQNDQEHLDTLEGKMAEGDLLRWVIRNFSELQARHHVEFSNFESPAAYDLDFFPKLPYKTALFSVVGTGFYSDWGLALADFEERFPLCRLQRLILEPSSGANGDPADAEKITLKMEFVALIKPE